MTDNFELSLFTESSIINSKKKLHALGLDIYGTGLKLTSSSISGGRYYRSDLKRSLISKSTVDKTNFNYAALTDSRFNNAVINDCELNYVSLQCCDFYNTTITTTTRKYITGTNFSQSNVTNSKLSNLKFKGCTFSQCYFMNSTIENCYIRSSTFENSVFDNCHIRDTNMARLNLEFISLKDSVFENTKLPYAQIPYMIGFMDALDSGSQNEIIEGNVAVGWEWYKHNLMDISRCFFGNGQMYPVANILASIGDMDNALMVVKNGIEKSLMIDDYRMVWHYCNLGARYGMFKSSDRKDIRNMISDRIRAKKDPDMVNKYLIYSGEISEILSNDLSRDTIQFAIDTNISSDRIDEINIILESLCRVIDDVKKEGDTYTVRISHNSDFSLLIDIATTAAPMMLNVLYSMIGNLVYDRLKEKNAERIKKSMSDIVLRGISAQNNIDYESYLMNLPPNVHFDNTSTPPIIESCNHRLISDNNYPLEVMVNGQEYTGGKR